MSNIWDKIFKNNNVPNIPDPLEEHDLRMQSYYGEIEMARRKAQAKALASYEMHQRQQSQQQLLQSMAIPNKPQKSRFFDVYERTQIALQQLQTLYLLGDLEKHELRNATKMVMSLDTENLVLVEEIIKSKL